MLDMFLVLLLTDVYFLVWDILVRCSLGAARTLYKTSKQYAFRKSLGITALCKLSLGTPGHVTKIFAGRKLAKSWRIWTDISR